MQKTSLLSILHEEVLRALVFGLSFFIILTSGFVGMAYAANGGIFGDILNKILASGNWEAPGDGTVKNSAKLGGTDASGYVKLGTNRSCGAGKCVQGFDSAGDVICN